MLQNYPSSGTLDLNIEQHIPQDAQLGLQSLMERSKIYVYKLLKRIFAKIQN
jgi:hypothetical protein